MAKYKYCVAIREVHVCHVEFEADELLLTHQVHVLAVKERTEGRDIYTEYSHDMSSEHSTITATLLEE